MDKHMLKREAWRLAAEGVYRSLLVLFSLVAGFSAFPQAKWSVAGLVLLISASVRAILTNQEFIEQRTRRSSWTEALTVRIALVELHNEALQGRRADVEWDGSMPLWDRARRAALEDLEKYDDDKGGLSALGGKEPGWGTAVLCLGLAVVGDLLCVGLAWLLSPAVPS